MSQFSNPNRFNQLGRNWIAPFLSLITYCLVTIALLWGIAVFWVRQDYDDSIQVIISSNNQLTLAFEDHIRHNLHAVDESLQAIKFEYERELRITPFIQRYYSKLSSDSLLNQSGLINEHGQAVISALPVSPGTSFADLPHFQYHQTADRWELFVGRPFVGRVSGRTSLHLSRRLNYPDGRFAGAVIAAVDPLFFTQFYQTMQLSPETVVRIVGWDGWIRASKDPDEPQNAPNLRSVGILFKNIEQNRQGHYTSVGAVAGKIRFFSYRTLADYPLIVQVGVDREKALASFYARRNTIFSIATALSLLIIAFTTVMMFSSRKRFIAEQRHQLLFQTLSAGVLYYDAGGNLLDSNPAAATILGISSAKLKQYPLSSPEWQCVDENGNSLTGEQFPAVIALRSRQTVEQKIIGIQKPNSLQKVWLSVTAVPQFHKNDLYPQQVFILFSDITAAYHQERSLLKDARLAQRIQRALLAQPEDSPWLDIQTIYRPYRFISGDLYFLDWHADRTLLRGYLVDVTGHGISTALHTAAVNVLLHEANDFSLTMSEQLCWLNQQSTKYLEDSSFVAALAFEIDLRAHVLRYSCAGISGPWLVSASSNGFVAGTGLMLGINPDEPYDLHEIPLLPDDALFFLSDGITDLLRKKPFTADGFAERVAHIEALSADADCRDDATAICIQIRNFPSQN